MITPGTICILRHRGDAAVRQAVGLVRSACRGGAIKPGDGQGIFSGQRPRPEVMAGEYVKKARLSERLTSMMGRATSPAAYVKFKMQSLKMNTGFATERGRLAASGLIKIDALKIPTGQIGRLSSAGGSNNV